MLSKSRDEYWYGFNGQEKSDETKGLGNSYTAEFWEYDPRDPRIARRWNTDPKPIVSESLYLTFGDNPIFYRDPLGDYETKFGAWVANILKGGEGIGKNTDAKSKNNGQWYYKKNTNHTDADGNVVVNPDKHYQSSDNRKVGSGGLTDGIPSVDKIANESAYAAKQAAKQAATTVINSDAWNSPLARVIVPDYITFGGSIQGSSGVYATQEGTFTLLLRGKDPGLYIVALESLLEMDHTLSEVIGIKPGYEETRDKVGAAWQIVETKE